jgi:hypothetical protein
MNKIKKDIFSLLSFNTLSLFALNLFLLFALDWIVWGEFIPQAGSLGLLEFVGLFMVLSGINVLLEHIPETVRMRR